MKQEIETKSETKAEVKASGDHEDKVTEAEKVDKRADVAIEKEDEEKVTHTVETPGKSG